MFKFLRSQAVGNITEEERQEREQLLKLEPIKQGMELVQSFRKLLAARKEGGLGEWIKQAEAAAGNPFKGFLTGVRRDYAAVEKAFTSPWSNGQTEGQVNRLKYLKRQMVRRVTHQSIAPAGSQNWKENSGVI